MTTHITVIDIKHHKIASDLDIVLMVDGEKRCYPTTIFDLNGKKIVSIADKDELIDILCRDRHKNREFMNLILSIYKGHREKLPVDFEF